MTVLDEIPTTIGQLVEEWNAGHPDNLLTVKEAAPTKPWITRDLQAQLMEPFPEQAIGILPKLSCRACTEATSRNCKDHAKKQCAGCGNFISERHVHLDYVGHGWVTHRFLTVDPTWNWEPMLVDQHGLPTHVGGVFWIRLTICGMTRMGVGDAAKKVGSGDWWKEVIGDALRNAGMRYGVALEMWQRDRHGSAPEEGSQAEVSRQASGNRNQSSSSGARPARKAVAKKAAAGPSRSLAEIRTDLHDRLNALQPEKHRLQIMGVFSKAYGDPHELKARHVPDATAMVEAGELSQPKAPADPPPAVDEPPPADDVAEQVDAMHRRRVKDYIKGLPVDDLAAAFVAINVEQPAELEEARAQMTEIMAAELDEEYPDGVTDDQFTEWFGIGLEPAPTLEPDVDAPAQGGE